MKLFSYLYDKTIFWSGHRHAPYYLAGISFAESSFFPIPPDVMLISMGLAAPHRSWRFAFIATLFSVLGGILGYLIGVFGMELIQPHLSASTLANFQHVSQWLKSYGIWVVILGAFTPFPYKVFTIAAGAMQLAFLPFVIGSVIGRGMRFFLVSAILFFTGNRIEARLRHYVDVIGWSLLVIFVIVYFFMKWIY
ncbi:DedA family protein [Legionella septentrionalis]|uniref:DedA family protein n=1 Tax=Legionella septentrionalis TaxID=2498109 RepID=A0A3S0VLZ7_9GAMM|nr:DedA family protein [Legionella septentrionalis]RUQ96350.1 DedA family protein [Legionella septentrionalis]RUR09109.1 DedA family protein [Legionella septentrionalis]RUR14171.1 DedA family protein [Legionella septentrionalis]